MLLGFKKRFMHPIQIGTKVHTLRGPRKRQPKIGETLHMYCGLRTKFCEQISNKERLISIQKCRVAIEAHKDYIHLNIFVDGRALCNLEITEFVKYDGFDGIRDFAEFWVRSSTGKKISKTVVRVGGILTIYHWTDLRY